MSGLLGTSAEEVLEPISASLQIGRELLRASVQRAVAFMHLDMHGACVHLQH